MLNLIVTSTPIELKFEDISLEEIKFILNGSNDQYLGEVPHFSCSNNDLDSLKGARAQW